MIKFKKKQQEGGYSHETSKHAENTGCHMYLDISVHTCECEFRHDLLVWNIGKFRDFL